MIFLKKRIFPVLCLILFCFSCGQLPDIVRTEPEPGEKYSADDVRYMTVDQPFMISGDYFRDKNEEDSIALNEIFSKSKQEKPDKQTGKNEEYKAESIENSRQMPVLEKKSSAEGVFFIKTGFIFNKNQVNAETEEKIIQAVPSAIKDLPIISAEQDKIEEVLTRANCPGDKNMLCLFEALGIYPGLRMVVIIEKFEIPAVLPGNLAALISVIDTGAGIRYPGMEISIPLASADDAEPAVTGVMHKVLAFAGKKSEIIPWFCRSFSHENGEWYISAGLQSGLKAGDILRVVSKGKLVKSPTGLPAGWIQGTQKGMMKVRQVFGEDFSVGILESGTGPGEEDLMVMP